MSLIANLLTLLRIVAIPFIIYGFFLEDKDHGAKLVFVLFIAASITDYLDGLIARKFNAGSKFGKMLDPIADKLLVAAILVMLVYDRQVTGEPRADLIPVLIIILREILVSGLREFLALEKILMPVTRLAKWKTTFQFLAVVALLAAPFIDGITIKDNFFGMQACGQILLWIAAVLTFVTGWQYARYTLHEGFKGSIQIKVIDDDEGK